MEARQEWSCPRCGRIEEGTARTCPVCGVALMSRAAPAQPTGPAVGWVRETVAGPPPQAPHPNITPTRPLDPAWGAAPPPQTIDPAGPRSVPTAADTSAWARGPAAPAQVPDPRPYVSADASSWVKGNAAAPPTQATQIAPVAAQPAVAGPGAAAGRSGGGRKIWLGAGFGFVGSLLASLILGALNVQSPTRDPNTTAILVGVIAGSLIPALLSAYPALLAGTPVRALRSGGLAALLGAVLMTAVALGLTQVADKEAVFFRGSNIAAGLLVWAAFGLALGSIDGLVGRAPRRVVLGGVGGALGGVIAFLLGYLLQNEGTFVVVGLLIGLGSGVIQEVAKQAWVTIVGGPNANMQAIVDKPVLRFGSSEDADIDFGLYRDAAVALRHFEVRRQEGAYLLVPLPNAGPLAVNGEAVGRERRLRDGDRIQIGGTTLQFNTRAG